MARTVAGLPEGTRITDCISLGVLAKTFPMAKVHAALAATGKMTRRHRDLPAHVVVYYVLARALYMEVAHREVLRCLLEGIKWLLGPEAAVKVAGRSGISQARTRLGWEPLQRLHDAVVAPCAGPQTRGARYRSWRLASLDGSTLDVADTTKNAEAFGRPGASRGTSASPQVRFVALVENGTHVFFGTHLGPYATGETTLAKDVVPALKPGMLCLADRNFFGFTLWATAHATGADLLWRVKKNSRLPCVTRLPDGSYLSTLYPSARDRRQGRNGRAVRVVRPRTNWRWMRRTIATTGRVMRVAAAYTPPRSSSSRNGVRYRLRRKPETPHADKLGGRIGAWKTPRATRRADSTCRIRSSESKPPSGRDSRRPFSRQVTCSHFTTERSGNPPSPRSSTTWVGAGRSLVERGRTRMSFAHRFRTSGEITSTGRTFRSPGRARMLAKYISPRRGKPAGTDQSRRCRAACDAYRAHSRSSRRSSCVSER